jgi:hypothetical protein
MVVHCPCQFLKAQMSVIYGVPKRADARLSADVSCVICSFLECLGSWSRQCGKDRSSDDEDRDGASGEELHSEGVVERRGSVAREMVRDV